MRRIVIGAFLRLLDRSMRLDYKQIDKAAFEEWAFRSFDDKGWRSYLAHEDLKILREMSFGKDRDQYMVLMGRRLQLLYTADEMRKAVENRKSAEERKRSEASDSQS